MSSDAELAFLQNLGLSGSVSDMMSTYYRNNGRLFRIKIVPYAASVTLDCRIYDIFEITLTGNITIDFTGAVNGQKALVKLKQDDTGSRLVTWGSGVAFSADITSAGTTASTGANKRDRYGFEYDGASAKYDMIAYSRGY